MLIIEKIKSNVEKYPLQKVMISNEKSLTYKEFWEKSEKVALYLEKILGNNRNPIVVYGHKDPMMLVLFIACARTNRAYCPVDISMPKERVMDIVNMVGNKVVLSTLVENNSIDDDYKVVSLKDIELICNDDLNNSLDSNLAGKDDDIFYIIFTSGSTGKPKGVEISHRALSNFTNWSTTLGEENFDLTKEMKAKKVFLNQAPFSFDLSVMDVYTSLASGSTIYSLTKEAQQDASKMIETIKQGNINYWVSTPSFADMCLANREFNQDLMPNITAFLFCGEKLTKSTAKKLLERFPKAKVINTYGPTESTVAVTDIEITKEMLEDEKELPIGRTKKGTEIKIDSENEELLIYGDTLSKGYYQDEERTDKAFQIDENGNRFYRTGDSGYYIDDVLYYKGRIDFQIKLHGYRIELGDIESNLMMLDGVSLAAVLPKMNKEGKIRHLVAFIVKENTEGSFEDGKEIKALLKKKLPDYMVPKKIVFLDNFPMTTNGKTDRKKLEEKL